MNRLWDRLFLEERPSIGMSFFRMFVAVTVGAHVFPTLFHLHDNYFSTAFKVLNTSFFPVPFLEFVQKSPQELILFFVFFFCVTWFFFLIGLFSQFSCILMTACCYYFYALNSFHVGTLSWDILLVTLFLMCVTPYHGDYFSVDCLLRGDENAYKRRRPIFLQRLLQLQIGFTYFYTALYKITAKGNWLSDNPIYYLMNYPGAGVTKTFLLRDYFMVHPTLCYWLGVSIIVIELAMFFLLFIPKTRITAIYLGFVFHITLILTFDVPAIFFFLFPPQLLLFINPDHIVRWIDQKRQYNRAAPRGRLIYDGHCNFCLWWVKRLKIMDLFETLEYIDLHTINFDEKEKWRGLTKEQAMSQFYLIEPNGDIYGGFHVFRRICFTMPMLYPWTLLFYFPGMGFVGPAAYRFVANNRYLFHVGRACKDNACFRK